MRPGGDRAAGGRFRGRLDCRGLATGRARRGAGEMNSKVVKKKKPVDGSKMAQEQVELFEKATKARYRIALAAYNAQDVVTKNVIDSIRDRLSTMATGYIRVFPHGKQQQSVPVKISQELVDSNI